MPRNNLGLDFGIGQIKPGSIFGPTNPGGKRTLGTRDREILWNRAKKRCENCGKKIDSGDMQAGHKRAASKGGKATISNSVCLCYGCNKRQGTDSWAVFRKKQGKSETRTVTSGKKRSQSKKKSTKRKSSSKNNWINSLTRRRKKAPSFNIKI